MKLQRETADVAPKPARGGKSSALVAQDPDYPLSQYCEVWLDRTGMDSAQRTMCRCLQWLE
jgi:hypothetical protein